MATTNFKPASAADLNQNSLKAIIVEGKSLLLANINGTYYAIGNVCTHRRCPLSNGVLKGDAVECACHGSVFNLKTGEVLRGPAKTPEPKYDVKVENLQVYVAV
jgi:3-phenylpropionate/trans-cinnamate dioxygenase ferredoxin subunit